MTPTSTYLHTVFGDLEGVAHIAVGSGGRHAESGRYEFATWSPSAFAWPSEADALERAITQAAAAGDDVYVCPYLMHGSKRAKGAAVARRIIHADIDHGHLDLGLVRALGGFAVGSGSPGNGHVYVSVDRSLTAAEHGALCRALGAFLGGADAKVTDNDVLRPPGTLNGKHEPAAAVSWLVEPTGRSWEPEALADRLGAVLTAPTAPAGATGATEPYDLSQAPQRLLDALALDSGDRSADTMRVLGAAHDAGLTLGQARTVVADREDLAERLADRADDDVLTCWLKVTDERVQRAAERRRESEWVAELVGAGVGNPTGGTCVPPDAPASPAAEAEVQDVAVGASWAALDLSETVAGVIAGTIQRPQPTIGQRTDGQALFYRGRVNGVAGSSNAGKSWTGFHAAAQEITSGQPVVYIDLEDDKAGAVARLLDLGVEPEVIVQRFHYVSPDEAFTAAAAEALARLLDEVAPSLVVIDSTGESLALDGAKPNDDDDVARWFRRLPTGVARRSGAAVLVLDHVTKAEDGGLWPIGSQRKRAAITGAQYMLVNVKPFDRSTAGFSKLVCAKDRHGNYHQGQTVALMHVTPGSSGVTLDLGVPQDTGRSGVGAWRPTAIMEKVSRLLEDADEPLSVNRIEKAAGVKKGKPLSTAVHTLIADGYVSTESGPRGAILHTSVTRYRQRSDPLSDLYDREGDGQALDHPQNTVRPSPSLKAGDGGRSLAPSPGDGRGTVGDGHESEEKSPFETAPRCAYAGCGNPPSTALGRSRWCLRHAAQGNLEDEGEAS